MIYFGQVASTGLIKIGFSANTERRRREIQAMNGDSFSLLCWIPGGQREEARLHHRFASLRAHGEWFNPGEELLEFIRNVSSAVVSPINSPPSRPPRPRTVVPSRPCTCHFPRPKITVDQTAEPADFDPLCRLLFKIMKSEEASPSIRDWESKLLNDEPVCEKCNGPQSTEY